MIKKLPIGNSIHIFVSDTHRFGTDGVLLADFAAPRAGERVCDLGTGCGIIPLVWTSRERKIDITAIDIQRDACDLLETAIKENGLSNIRVECADLRLLGVEYNGRFDLVTMNPPYKTANGGKCSKNEGLVIARHEVKCTMQDAAKAAARLLKDGGRFCICNRPERLSDAVCAMKDAGVGLKKLRMVTQRAGKEASLFLAEGVKNSKSGVRILPELILENSDGSRTDELKKIYKYFYEEDD